MSMKSGSGRWVNRLAGVLIVLSYGLALLHLNVCL